MCHTLVVLTFGVILMLPFVFFMWDDPGNLELGSDVPLQDSPLTDFLKAAERHRPPPTRRKFRLVKSDRQ